MVSAGVGQGSGGLIIDTFGDRERECSAHDRALCHCTVRDSRSAEEHALPVAEMPHTVCAAHIRKVARTGIVEAAGQSSVDRFQRRGVNLYDALAVTSGWLRELLVPRRFP